MMLRLLETKFYWLLPLFFWLFMVGASYLWNQSLLDEEVHVIAMERGKIMYEMVKKAKINPTVMTTDPTLFKKQEIDNIGYRVVSSTPKNEENRANAWEIQILQGFSQSSDFAFMRDVEVGEEVYRYLGPVFMQQNCLACHGGEGVQVGDIRGGISVVVKSQPIYAAQQSTRQMMSYMHIGGFLILSALSIFFMRRFRTQWIELEETQEQLVEKEKFLTDITNSMGEGFLVLNPEGEVKYANPESEWLLGWQSEEVVGKKMKDLVYAKSDSPDDGAIEQTLHDGLTRKDDDHVFLHRDGRKVPVAYSVSPLHEDHHIRGAVITFGDITERKAHEEERRRLERELNQTHKMEAVGHLAGGIAHEINTPIQYVGDNLRFLKEAYEDVYKLLRAYAGLHVVAKESDRCRSTAEQVDEALDEADIEYLEEEVPKALEQSIAGTEQVARIVQAMKEFAHPGSKSMAMEDINRIVNNAVAVSKNEWKYAADTSLKLDPNLPQVECIGGEISQVILNLVVNAAHAIKSADHGVKGLITVSTRTDGDMVEIRVSDNGIGISEDIHDSVFNPFFTTKDVGKGTGQGLAIAQDIVAVKHRGELFFETEMGVGTSFIIHLPLKQQESESYLTSSRGTLDTDPL
jgi:PAS domain S-box-containing protein